MLVECAGAFHLQRLSRIRADDGQIAVIDEVQALIDKRQMGMRQLQRANHWQWSTRRFIGVNALPVGASCAITRELQLRGVDFKKAESGLMAQQGCECHGEFRDFRSNTRLGPGRIADGDLFCLDPRASG